MEQQTPPPPPQCIIPLHKPSYKELAFFFASGILVSIPFALFFENLVPAAVGVALFIVVLAPFIEEIAKVFPRNRAVNRDFGLVDWLGFWHCRVC
jgi:hypothetical protein